MNPYISSVFALIFTYFSLKKSIPCLNKYLLDKPNKRSSHNKPKPRGGGIIFVLIGSFFCIFYGNNIPIFCIPLSLVGILDDLYDLPASLRYLAQLITALVLIFIIFNSSFTGLNFPYWIYIFFYFFGVIFITAIINFINFMDGIDGLVAGCFSIIFFSASYINEFTVLPLVGSVIGFLILNWHPSKLFMGDTGSTFLGAVLAGLIFKSESLGNAISILIISSPLLLDSTICLFRRFCFGHNIFKAHKLHLYQRLVQSGWSHAKVSKVYIFATALLSIVYFIWGLSSLLLFSLLLLIIGIYLDLYIAVPFKILNERN